MSAEQDGRRNPLVISNARESPNLALAVTLEGGFEAVLKRAHDARKAKKHRSRAKKFEALGGFRRVKAQSADDVRRLLDFFFACKAKRFEAAGIPDSFAAPETRAALRETFSRALAEERPSFVLHGLEVGGVLRAVSGASVAGSRITCEFASFAEDDIVKQSPGEFLFHLNIDEACRLGFATYDFGVGDETYKRQWCDRETTHFDLVLPVSVKGRIFAEGLRAWGGAKRALKRHSGLWNAFKRLRRQLAGRRSEPAMED